MTKRESWVARLRLGEGYPFVADQMCVCATQRKLHRFCFLINSYLHLSKHVNLPEFIVTLQNRIALVEDRVVAACKRAGRSRSDVTVVAVTKTLSADAVRHVPETGLVHLAENRPQEFWKRAAAMPEATWHFVGHLQRNKIDKTLPLATLLHSVDSVRLLQAIDADAAKQKRVADVLLEVNASGEATKQGFAPDAVVDLVPQVNAFEHVRVRGLMTMAAPLPDPDACRTTFAALRTLRKHLRPLVAAHHDFRELSMGMSNDFSVAIEEGATLIRLGSIYFDGLDL
jgi:pyridoxal phosphate enzyme (YggS family)